MAPILALAVKDLRLLLRLRAGLFFTFVWPLLIAVGFGFILSGPSSGQSKISVALVDEDHTPGAAAFLARLEGTSELETAGTARAEAEESVRTGRRRAYIAVPSGFGLAAERLFYGAPPTVQLGLDPSHAAERGMMEGVLMKYATQGMQEVLSDPQAGHRAVENALKTLHGDRRADPDVAATVVFLGELDKYLQRKQRVGSAAAGTPASDGSAWMPLHVVKHEVTGARVGPRHTFEFTFPQGVVWGLIGCIMSFAVGLVVERTHGTLVRLQTAPLTRTAVLAGKGLGCFLTAIVLQAIMFALATLVFQVHVHSFGGLLLATMSAAAAFVGIMMLVAAIGRNEQSTSAAGWAILMPMSMIGGAMIPLFAMPPWLVRLSDISPVKWAILAFEGATWRAFAPAEMLLPCGILIGVGLVAFALGTRFVRTM